MLRFLTYHCAALAGTFLFLAVGDCPRDGGALVFPANVAVAAMSRSADKLVVTVIADDFDSHWDILFSETM